ncbi:MAG: hypothetical protein ACXVAO_17280 [Vulcanimicrobiaceae bacterium]
MSAYSVDRTVRGHTMLYRPFKRGNMYHAIEQLAQSGFLLARSVKAKRGPRKTKIEYRLSAAGEKRFRSLLVQILDDIQAPDPTLEIAYVLLGQLPREQAVALLETRAAHVAQQERRLNRLFSADGRSGSAYLGASHAAQRMPKWEPQWTVNDGPANDGANALQNAAIPNCATVSGVGGFICALAGLVHASANDSAMRSDLR